tara:strand:+ start:185 stop:376 length:192 start_codon:yes stop_codon:yes gene_type:complete
MITEYESLIKEQQDKINALNTKNNHLASKLIESQNTYQGQAIFLDALENLLLDHGYKLVDANE